MEITDLEAVALGQVLKFQPCTAHLIRKSFDGSLSSQFSDSAGSVYPMLKRLEKRGWVTSDAVLAGKRTVHYYSCTNAGRRAHRYWLGPPIKDCVNVPSDPLRTRMIFLSNLSISRRSAWFEKAEAVLMSTLVAIRRRASDCRDAEPDNVFDQLANENARLSVEARLKWLHLAKAKLTSIGMVHDGKNDFDSDPK